MKPNLVHYMAMAKNKKICPKNNEAPYERTKRWPTICYAFGFLALFLKAGWNSATICQSGISHKTQPNCVSSFNIPKWLQLFKYCTMSLWFMVYGPYLTSKEWLTFSDVITNAAHSSWSLKGPEWWSTVRIEVGDLLDQ